MNFSEPLPIRLVVGHQILDLGARVRILHRQPTTLRARIAKSGSRTITVARSSSGPGHGPLKAETGVRLPYGLPILIAVLSLFSIPWVAVKTR